MSNETKSFELSKNDIPAVSAGASISLPAIHTTGLAPSSTTQSIPYYIREATPAVHQKLNNKNILLSGPPGSGKSTAVWLWLLQYVSTSEARSAVWYHFDESGENTFAHLSSRPGDDQITIEYRDVRPTKDISELCHAPVDVCVIDGMRTANKEKV